jgi:branched-chain amino acid transport system substrate-binding protein
VIKRTGVTLVCAVVLAVPACSSNAGSGDTSSGPIHVGGIFALTGLAQIFGTQQKNGAQLAVDEINAAGGVKGRKIELKVLDEASTKDQAINAVQKLVSDPKTMVVMGPTLSGDGQAVAPIANAAKVPDLGVSWAAPTGTTDVGPYIWRDNLTDGQNIPTAMKAAQTKLGFKNAGLLYGSDDAFTKAGGETFKKAANDLGVNLVDTETFAQTDQDFSSQLTKLKSHNPQVLCISATGAATATIISQARKLGLDMPVVGGNGFNSPTVPKNAGPAADGVIVAAAWDASSASTNPTNKKFIDAFTSKYGSPPDQFAAQAYTGVQLIKYAIEQGGASREGIVSGFKKVQSLDTPLGKFSFTADRNAQQEPVTLTIENGKYTRLG